MFSDVSPTGHFTDYVNPRDFMQITDLHPQLTSKTFNQHSYVVALLKDNQYIKFHKD